MKYNEKLYKNIFILTNPSAPIRFYDLKKILKSFRFCLGLVRNFRKYLPRVNTAVNILDIHSC